MAIHDLARKFLTTNQTAKWKDTKKTAVFEFADWFLHNAPKSKQNEEVVRLRKTLEEARSVIEPFTDKDEWFTDGDLRRIREWFLKYGKAESLPFTSPSEDEVRG